MVKFTKHPFFYGVYANPEFTAKPLKPDPLYWLWLLESKKHHGI